MRRRAIQMVSFSVAIAIFFFGIPLVLLGVWAIKTDAELDVAERASAIVQLIDLQHEREQPITAEVLERYRYISEERQLYVEYQAPSGDIESVGYRPRNFDRAISVTEKIPNGGQLTVSLDAAAVMQQVIIFLLLALFLALGVFSVGLFIALRQSRRVCAPLIYLAASAEQLGASQVRPKIEPSGIEEIDLVSQELNRTADRVAARIAAERQFAAAAAHQLRTPLTALSMRIEEIQYLTDDEQVVQEAEIALAQIERLSGVINELMDSTKKAAHGQSEALQIEDIFRQQHDEWAHSFANLNRELKFVVETDVIVLATSGSVAQILATLIENSLKYGAGATTVRATKSASIAVIKVSDEGTGIAEEYVPIIFQRGISAGGSTGIGLAVAKELAGNIGGRLELTNPETAEFTLTMLSVPASFNPSLVMPHGAAYTVGARRHRR